ncbi:MAG: hypothetical protein F4100_06095 [Rhodothermaceae bacterium]|nr:hypothetical protein [Rhodothermaceae bacterium]MYE61801.1 hypothetical protein [Rhodothermaceae bacterium]MYJ20299.1 hypothetical protein [Rhodothermaceae bacterium]
MKRICLLFLLSAMTVSVQGQAIFPNILQMVDSLRVTVDFSNGEDATQCTPFESAVKTRIELRLRRAGIRVVDLSPTQMHFSTVAVHAGLCAVSYSTQVVMVAFPDGGDMVVLLGLENSGIMTRSQYSESREAVRIQSDEAADLVANEILKARQ